MSRVLLVCAAVLLLISLALAADEFVMPRAFHARTYPAHEEHPNEQLAIAADPYDLPDKAQPVFRGKYRENGFLPLHLIISNDAAQPVSLVEMKVQLITVKGVKINPATIGDIYRRMAKVRPSSPADSPLPIPLPRRGDKKVREAMEEVEMAQFRARAVEPRNTQAGFLFFDVSGISQPLAGAHLYITGIRDSEGNELFYFEIPMEKYLTYQPGAPPAEKQ